MKSFSETTVHTCRFSLDDPENAGEEEEEDENDDNKDNDQNENEAKKPKKQDLAPIAAFARQHPSTNTEMQILLDDLQVLGRSEFKQLLKW